MTIHHKTGIYNPDDYTTTAKLSKLPESVQKAILKSREKPQQPEEVVEE